MPAANPAGNARKPMLTRENLRLQFSNQSRPDLLGSGPLRFCSGFTFWNLGFSLNGFCRFNNQIPRFAQMLFRREHVAKTDPHNCSTAQLCLREVRASGSVDSLYDFAVESIQAIDGAGASSLRVVFARRSRRGSNKPKTDHTHARLRRYLKAFVLFDPLSEELCQTNLFAQAGDNSSSA